MRGLLARLDAWSVEPCAPGDSYGVWAAPFAIPGFFNRRIVWLGRSGTECRIVCRAR